MNTAITCTAEMAADFASVWPCSRFPTDFVVTVEFDHRGDLVDLYATSEGKPFDTELCDGGAMVAFVSDLKEHLLSL